MSDVGHSQTESVTQAGGTASFSASHWSEVSGVDMPTVASSTAVETPSQARGARMVLLAIGMVGAIAYVVVITSVRVTTTVTEALQAGTDVPTKVTKTSQPLGETTSSAMLGAVLVLLLAGAFYSRIKKITGPGGVAVEFNPDEKEAAADAVADQIKDKPSAAKDAMVAPEAIDAGEAADATRDISHRSIKASLDTLQEARDLLKAAHSSTEDAQKLASEWNLPSDLTQAAITDLRIPNELWPALAKRALSK